LPLCGQNKKAGFNVRTAIPIVIGIVVEGVNFLYSSTSGNHYIFVEDYNCHGWKPLWGGKRKKDTQ
jgi:hypothetical protein